MARKTSIDVYHQIKKEGLLSAMRFKVYEALVNIGKPSTAREIFATMNLLKMEPTRLTELRDLGVIYEKGVRSCEITDRNVIEYDLTDNLPDMDGLKKKCVKPKNLKRCIDYIISVMGKDGLMFITEEELNTLKDA